MELQNEIEKVTPFKKEMFGKRAYISKVEVGKWFRFEGSCATNNSTYGKVVKIENDIVYAEKVFEIPDYRPYGGEKWFDRLPSAIL